MPTFSKLLADTNSFVGAHLGDQIKAVFVKSKLYKSSSYQTEGRWCPKLIFRRPYKLSVNYSKVNCVKAQLRQGVQVKVLTQQPLTGCHVSSQNDISLFV